MIVNLTCRSIVEKELINCLHDKLRQALVSDEDDDEPDIISHMLGEPVGTNSPSGVTPCGTIPRGCDATQGWPLFP